MKNYQSQNPSKNFVMVDKGIDDDLTPDAYYLLIKLMKLAPNENNSNDALKKKTGFSKRRFDRAKKALVIKGYLDTKQLYGNHYAIYIGKESVKDYKKRLKKSDNRYEQNEIRKIKEKNVDSCKKELSKL
ncbi:helix-turn-helix domain-containing protein [Sulfurovum sp. CS9]|uniref:helix-turn-helix domain-containing protein n=1 Tax=Sulfurovum sp. CS9 TaxID=3391146 RepID=UPI0039ED195C